MTTSSTSRQTEAPRQLAVATLSRPQAHTNQAKKKVDVKT